MFHDLAKVYLNSTTRLRLCFHLAQGSHPHFRLGDQSRGGPVRGRPLCPGEVGGGERLPGHRVCLRSHYLRGGLVFVVMLFCVSELWFLMLTLTDGICVKLFIYWVFCYNFIMILLTCCYLTFSRFYSRTALAWAPSTSWPRIFWACSSCILRWVFICWKTWFWWRNYNDI